MNYRFIHALKYIKYWLFAKHKKGHGIHSPFVYDLIKNVFNKKVLSNDLSKITNIHSKYKKFDEILNFTEIGAGSGYRKSRKTSVGQIIKRSSINHKYGSLLYNLIQYFNPKEILELGTSVGISTAYIAGAAPDSKFISIEGVEAKIKIAKEITSELKQHTKFIQGDFDLILKSVIEKYDHLDLVFFDGNHNKNCTIEYFEICLTKIHNDSIFLFDDIHWSTEMEDAWEFIKNHSKVKVSIDLFRAGLIFFRKELSKQHYIIKF